RRRPAPPAPAPATGGRSAVRAWRAVPVGCGIRSRRVRDLAPGGASWARRYTSAPANAPISDDRTDLPGHDPAPERLLGETGLRADPAAGPRSRCRHLPPGDLPARAGARAMECGLRAALAPSHRRPLRREPQPPAALLPVPGGDEAQPGQHRRAVLRLAEGAG